MTKQFVLNPRVAVAPVTPANVAHGRPSEDTSPPAANGPVDAYLESLLACAPSCVAVVRGYDLRFTVVNERYQAIRPDFPMPGHTYRDVFPEAADGGAEARLRAVLDTGKPWPVERYVAPVPGKPDATWEGQVTRLPFAPGEPPAALIVLWDVTDQRRTEEALRESEDHYRHTVELSPQIPWTADPDGDVLDFNQRLLNLTGLTRDQALGGGWVKAIHPEDIPAVENAWSQAVRTGQPYDVEQRIRLADGTYRWMRARALPRRDATGRVIRWYGTTEDVHDRRQAEDALLLANLQAEERVRQRTAQLAEANAKYQTMWDQGIFAWILALDGILVDANRSSLEQCGFTRDDVIGRPFWECGWWNRSAAVQAWIRAGIAQAAGGVPFRGESAYFVADGSQRVVEFALMPIKDDVGRVLYLFPTGIDVTERRSAEHDRLASAILRESESRFRLIADALPQIVWVARADGFHEYHNRRWYEYTGLGPEQPGGDDQWANLIHPDDVAVSRASWERALDTGEPYEVEHRLRRRDGQYRWFLARALPVGAADGRHPAKWYCTATDVHDKRELLAQREHLLLSERAARDEAERANRAKDRFFAVLSHELRTPLSPVLMTASAMGADPDLPERFRDDLLTIRRNVELEATLIDDLLDLSRITSGKLHLRSEPVSLHALLQHVLEVCATDLLAKRLRIIFDLRATQDRVAGDPARLQQVFWNLLKNAVKFSPETSLVTLRTADHAAGHIRVEVADEGVGIPPDVLSRVFDAFEQGDPAVTRQFGGLGLGLAISRNLVELHGGTIAADSAGANLGATFTVILPVHLGADHIAAPDSSSVPQSAIQHPQSLKILLVEDHPESARILAQLLARSGSAVQTAHTVADALRLGRSRPFDLLISDIGLPDGTGLDVMRELRPLGLTGIALSGFGTEADARNSRDAGFAEHLTKPLTLEDVSAAIVRVTAPRR